MRTQTQTMMMIKMINQRPLTVDPKRRTSHLRTNLPLSRRALEAINMHQIKNPLQQHRNSNNSRRQRARRVKNYPRIRVQLGMMRTTATTLRQLTVHLILKSCRSQAKPPLKNSPPRTQAITTLLRLRKRVKRFKVPVSLPLSMNTTTRKRKVKATMGLRLRHKPSIRYNKDDLS